MPIFKQFCPAVWESIRHQDQADTHTQTDRQTDTQTYYFIYIDIYMKFCFSQNTFFLILTKE